MGEAYAWSCLAARVRRVGAGWEAGFVVRPRTTIFTPVAVASLAAVFSTGASAVAAPTTRTVAARVASPGATWGGAIEVPGLAALNAGGYADVSSVSCTWGGYCAVGGYYTDGAHHGQAFVASQRRGVWGTATRVPGLGALNTGDEAQVTSVSCTSAGNCAAGGTYTNKRAHRQAFVVSERSGVWGKAIQIPGLAALTGGGKIVILYSLSCSSAGNCSAGGLSSDGRGNRQAFVVTERNGVWGKALQVPDSAALNTGGYSLVTSVSCASAGSCSAGGWYTQGRFVHFQAFVVGEHKGVWGKAIPVPGLAALNTDQEAQITSVSCGSPGDCAAVGFYTHKMRRQAFVASEHSGVWRKAVPMPGLAALNSGGGALATSVSCASAGDCAAGGWYKYGARSSHWQPFVIGETNGTWRQARTVPGAVILNTGGRGQLASVSCSSAGNCAAGGSYTDASGHLQAFVV